MPRGGRNQEVEKDRMKAMEQYTYYTGRTNSGPVNFEKAGYTSRKEKSPKSARKP